MTTPLTHPSPWCHPSRRASIACWLAVEGSRHHFKKLLDTTEPPASFLSSFFSLGGRSFSSGLTCLPTDGLQSLRNLSKPFSAPRKLRTIYSFILLLTLLSSTGCSNLPGRPSENSIPIDPDNVTDFALLYSKNCSGCHGAEAKGGAALSIGDPVYLAIADDSTLRRVVTNGIAGTSMPAFAKSAGGMLTDNQVDVIVRGIRERYSKPNTLAGIAPPAYSSTEPGDATRGAAVYDTFCASCHGPAGKGGPKAGSIVDGSFLALLTDQELRTLVIVGRPDLGAPDWRNNVPGKPMTSQEISDVVAWLSAQRPQFAGRPYPSVAKPAGELP